MNKIHLENRLAETLTALLDNCDPIVDAQIKFQVLVARFVKMNFECILFRSLLVFPVMILCSYLGKPGTDPFQCKFPGKLSFFSGKVVNSCLSYKQNLLLIQSPFCGKFVKKNKPRETS